MQILERLLINFNYAAAFILFLVGFYTMLTRSNLVKKVIGMNIMDTAVFLFLVSIGYRHNGWAPIAQVGELHEAFVNPLPGALVLTGIVVSLSVTAFALTLMLKLYKYYGSLDSQGILWAEVDD